MDRPLIYTQEQGRSTDFLFGMRSAMIGLAKLSAAVLGTGTIAHGLACTPTSPASMQVNVGAGEIYFLTNVDGTAYGVLPADTADQIVKQGISLSTVALSCPAPVTSGQSINYLIEATYQDSDTNPVVLPYFNSANPSIPLNGPGGLGGTNPTQRQGLVSLQAKAGTPATTGSQTTPSPDAGYVGLFVVTVAFGASSITAGNITQYSGAPFVSSILQMLQTGSGIYAVDTSASANTISLALTPPITSYVDGEPIRFKAANTNTGNTTINWGGGSLTLTGMNGTLQGGEIVAGKQYEAMYSSASGTAILIGQTAGPLQVAPATQSQHAVQMAQAAGVVGSVRNLVMSIPAVSSTATLTADEIIVETALGGIRYCLSSFSQSINLATTGAGGMDTGAAPASGSVAIYAIYNPTTKTAALLATNATSAAAPEIYAGGNMPSGYTASALVAVHGTSAGSQFNIGYWRDRSVWGLQTQAFSTSALAASFTSIAANNIPFNAREVSGYIIVTNSTANNTPAGAIAASATGIGQQAFSATSAIVAGGLQTGFSRLPIITPRTLFYTLSVITSGSPNLVCNISGYTI